MNHATTKDDKATKRSPKASAEEMPAEDVTQKLQQCTWPQLSAPYDAALRQAVIFIFQHVPDLVAITASGTIIRGTPAASSDLDIYVIRRRPERQRIQRWFNNVPAEIFINPAHQVPRYLDTEHKAARPITAHLLVTGFTIYATGKTLAEIKALARTALNRRPDLSTEQLMSARYMAAARLEDGLDMLDERPETAMMILTLAVYDMLHYRFLMTNQFRPRDKDLLDRLAALDAPLAARAKAFFRASSPQDAAILAKRIADDTIETHGFFEWASSPETIPLDAPSAQDKRPT